LGPSQNATETGPLTRFGLLLSKTAIRTASRGKARAIRATLS